jgi:hypothetical protein
MDVAKMSEQVERTNEVKLNYKPISRPESSGRNIIFFSVLPELPRLVHAINNRKL